MSRPMTLAALPIAVLVLVVLAPPAGAKIADRWASRVSTSVVGTPTGSLVPSCISAPRAPMPVHAYGFVVQAVDYNNAPLWYETVTIDFSATNVRLLADDTPGTTVDCANRTIRRLTGQDGIAVFRPRFCGSSAGATVIVHIDGIVLRELEACSTDLDADGITGLFDFARLIDNFLDGSSDPATDFSPCAAGSVGSAGRTTLADFAIFVEEMLRDRAGGPACP